MVLNLFTKFSIKVSELSIKASIDRLATHAASQEAFDGGKGTAFSSSDVVEGYFQKYGNTVKKFDYHPNPGFYIGYVSLPNRSEILSVVIIQPNGSIIVSFEPDIAHGQDMLGLMEKKIFADQVADTVKNALLGKT